ncbi:MAG TPA: SRPBCC family protein [Solirubrobacteraceae bacterium]|nr:SRPBCC family protein [Solirubrobacteraceae bacterium]
MEHEHTEFVAALPERVFSALADVENLPRYVPQVIGAERIDADRVRIRARYEGHTQEGEAWFRADDSEHRIEWGSLDGGYHGWIEVTPEREGSRLRLFLATVHGDAPDSEVMGTLDAIRRLVEANV